MKKHWFLPIFGLIWRRLAAGLFSFFTLNLRPSRVKRTCRKVTPPRFFPSMAMEEILVLGVGLSDAPLAPSPSPSPGKARRSRNSIAMLRHRNPLKCMFMYLIASYSTGGSCGKCSCMCMKSKGKQRVLLASNRFGSAWLGSARLG